MKYKVTMPKSCTRYNSNILTADVKAWLEKNVGERRENWEYPTENILEFVNEDDSINFALTWT